MSRYDISEVKTILVDGTQQLSLQDIFPFLVLLRRLVRLVVCPSDELLALSTLNIPDDVLASRHAALLGFAWCNVDDFAEEKCFAMLASKVLVKQGQR